MSPSKRWAVVVVTLLLAVAVTPAHAQIGPPLAFESSSPGSAIWPNAIEATVLNNTTEALVVTVQITNFTDPQTGVTLPSNTLLEPYAPSITLPPAGQATVTLPVTAEAQPAPGSYTGSLVFLIPDYNAVLRKPFTIVVPLPTVEMARSEPPPLTAVVDTWTINAVRVLPFMRPICMRGLAFGCTLPVQVSGALPEAPVTLGHLTNERGGGVTVTLNGVDERENARLNVAFDRPWGLTGVYNGPIDLPTAEATSAAESIDLTLMVKDIILWPLLCIGLGVMLVRWVQRHVTVHRDVLRLLRRLSSVGARFDRLRKSIHGYTIAEDFQARREELKQALLRWDRTHYGEPAQEEKARFQREIIAPLEALEAQMDIWAHFREKLERLETVLELEATPAIEQAERPGDIDLDVPRFYTGAVDLLEGAPIELSQMPRYAQRVEEATSLAASWGELEQLATLVRQAIRDLNAVNVDLSEGEQEMLERARHDLNSAARDLWEARDLSELQRRRTQIELESARELTRRLMDPFVYYTGSAPVTEGEALAVQSDEGASLPGDPRAVPQPMVRTYAHLTDYRLPRLDYDLQQPPQSLSGRTGQVDRPLSERPLSERSLLFGERAVTVAALTVAVLAGLQRYVTKSFGSTADYLTLFTWALAAKAGLELANLTLSRLIDRRDGTRSL